MPRAWLAFFIFFLTAPVRALEAPGPPDLNRPETLHWAMLDNPRDLHAWIKNSYRSLALQKDSIQRLRAFNSYAQLVMSWDQSWDESEDMSQVAEEALRISLKHGWTAEYLELYASFRHPRRFKENPSPDEISSFYRDTIVLIKKMQGPPQHLYNIQMRYAVHLESNGQLQQAIRLASETYEAQEKDSRVPALFKLVNLMDIADLFNKTGELDRANTIWDIAYRELRDSKLRTLSSIMMNSVGHQHFRQHTEASYKKAAAFYQHALQAAQDLQDLTQTAYVHVSLSRLAWKSKDFKEGISQAEKSLRLLEPKGDALWIGEAYLQKSRNQLELGLYQDALNSAIKAQQHYDPNNLFDQRYVEQIKAEALKGLKLFDEAFAALKLAYEIDSRLAKEQSHAEVSSQLADLGLKVEKAKSEALTRESEQKENELKDARRFRIITNILLVLAILVIGLMIFSLREKKLLEISQKKLRAILDHIDEAIVLIQPNLSIESEYSRFLESLIEAPSLVGAHAINDILRPLIENRDDTIIIQNVLEACFHEDQTAWDLNEGHLLQESQRIMHDEIRYFSLNWQPIYSSDSRLVRVLLGIRDVTGRKRMEADFAAERKEKSSLFEKVQELLSVDRVQAVQVLDRIQQLQSCEDLSRIRFELHGIKGLSRTLRLRQLAEAIHNMESALALKDAPISWHALESMACSYRHILDEVLVTHESMKEAGSLADLMVTLLPDLKQRAEAIHLEWRSMVLEDGIKSWDHAELEVVRELLLHATSNSLDHGYKFPRERGQSVGPFHLSVSCQEQDGQLLLRIQDGGAGINWAALAEKARRQQMTWQSQDELSAVLFKEGMSTAEELSATSGRGVGLSAMKYSLERMSGTISIESRIGAGTVVTCTWPRIARIR